MADYNQLSARLHVLVDETFAFFVKSHGFREGSEDRYYLSSVAGGETITRHGGHWVTDKPMKESIFHPHTPAAWFDHFQDRVHRGFLPWHGLPDPTDFHGYAKTVFEAATTNTPASSRTTNLQVENSNSRIQDTLTLLESEIGGFHGATMHEFNRLYASRLPSVLMHQASLGSYLGAMLNYEGHIWDKARHDVANLVEDAIDTMTNLGGTGGDLALAVAVAGSIAAFTALVVTDGTAAPLLVGAGSAGLGTLGKFLPMATKPHDDSADLGGPTPDLVLDHVGQGLHTINLGIRAHERAMHESIQHARDITRGSAFDLATPALLEVTDASSTSTAEDEDAILRGATVAEIKINAGDLNRVAHHDLPPIAHELTKAEHTMDRALAAGIWVRDGSVGLGDRGPFDAWQALADHYVDLLHGTSLEIHRASEHLLDATHILQAGDAKADADLRRHKRAVHA